MKILLSLCTLAVLTISGFGQQIQAEKLHQAAVQLRADGAGPIPPEAVVAHGLIDQFGNVVFDPHTGLFTFRSTSSFTAPVLTAAVLTPKVTVLTVDGAIPKVSGVYILEKGTAAAMSVAAPSSQDGTRISILSNTNAAHVITFTGTTLLDGTTGANSTATFTAFKGASVTVVARGAFWLVESFNQCTIAP